MTIASHFAAFWRRAGTAVLVLAILAAMSVVTLTIGGCGEATPPAGTFNPPSKPVIADPLPKPAPGSVAAKEHEVAEAQAVVTLKQAELDTLRLAPLRTSIAWAAGISLLGMLAGIGLAVAAMFWGLGFAWKIPAAVALGFAGILCGCLFTSWALGHVAWLIAGVIALAVLAALWATKKHLNLASATRRLWDATPETAPALPVHVEQLLDQIAK